MIYAETIPQPETRIPKKQQIKRVGGKLRPPQLLGFFFFLFSAARSRLKRRVAVLPAGSHDRRGGGDVPRSRRDVGQDGSDGRGEVAKSPLA